MKTCEDSSEVKKELGKKALGGKRVCKEYLDYIDIAIPIPIIKGIHYTNNKNMTQ